MIKIAIMGYGAIGSGVAEVLEQNRDMIAKQVGQEVELEHILDLRELPDSPVAGRIVYDFKMIEQDEEISIVVETVGDLNPIYPLVKACLLADEYVATSNKTLTTAYGTELLAVAREEGMNFLSETSIGGGTPIIGPSYHCLIGERIEEVTGVLDGTTNFILAKMDKENESSENILKEAQNLGYVGRNLKADVKGHDTYQKIAILTAVATGREANFEDIYTEEIIRIMDIDFKYTEKVGVLVRLSGSSCMVGDKVNTFVVPVMIQKNNPLYSINDVFNGTMVRGDMLGASMFYRGRAGKLPTVSAVVADIIKAAQNLERSLTVDRSSEKQAVEPMDLVRFRYFVRVTGSYHNKEEDIKCILGKVEVAELYGMGESIVLIAEMSEGELRAATMAYSNVGQARSDYGVKQMTRAMI